MSLKALHADGEQVAIWGTSFDAALKDSYE
jgi:hypothetical protein